MIFCGSTNRMTHAQARSYRGSIERAAREHEVRQAAHDATTTHEWIDVTQFRSVTHEYRCRYCSATMTVPFATEGD
jgi:hypothetical protein